MNAFKVLHQIKLALMVIFLGINVSLVFYYIFWPSKYESRYNNLFEPDAIHSYDLHEFLVDLNVNRMNKLLEIMLSKEKGFQRVFDK